MTEIALTDADFQQMVMADNGQPLTTSLKVAEYFGKAHRTVLRSIRTMKCSGRFRLRNFVQTFVERPNPKGGKPIKSTVYEMTKDGFMFLVMGFTGEKADQIKEAFIEAFNWMAEQLRARAASYSQMRNELLLEFRQEKAVASLAGRALQCWQLKKPVIEQRMQAVEQDGQLALGLA